MDQNILLLREQLNRIESLLIDVKFSSSITKKIVENSSKIERPKPASIKKGGNKNAY